MSKGGVAQTALLRQSREGILPPGLEFSVRVSLSAAASGVRGLWAVLCGPCHVVRAVRTVPCGPCREDRAVWSVPCGPCRVDCAVRTVPCGSRDTTVQFSTVLGECSLLLI